MSQGSPASPRNHRQPYLEKHASQQRAQPRPQFRPGIDQRMGALIMAGAPIHAMAVGEAAQAFLFCFAHRPRSFRDL